MEENNLGMLQKWARHLLFDGDNKGQGTRLPVLVDKECIDDEVVSIRELRIISCKKPYHLCGASSYSKCEPYYVQTLIEQDVSSFGLKMREYKTVVERINAGDCTIKTTRELFILCHDLHNLADLDGQRKSLTRATLRYQQDGQCIFPYCKKGRGLHLHRCLPGFLGGEYSEENCVLVCSQHHPQLEQFRSKTEVMEYLNEGIGKKQ